MASRRIEDLVPTAQAKAREHVLRCADAKIELLIYCTLRDPEEQARLFRQGRTPQQVQGKVDQLRSQGFPQLAQTLSAAPGATGAKVTFAGPGESFHQYAMAYDCVPVVKGKPVWQTGGEAGQLWRKVGELGKACGLEWAGEWTKFREFPHFQWTDGRAVQVLMKERFGKKPAAPAAAGAAGLESTAAPAGQPVSLEAAALGLGSESAALRQALDEPFTTFLVFGAQPGVDPAALRDTHDRAVLVAKLRPDRWRTFLVQDPAGLDGDLASLIWPGGDTAPVVLLGIGAGLARARVRTFQLADLVDSLDIAGAFTQGTAGA
jgi:peptidoglycan L-alanyl-D-glutamate endopeptidase CwlK